jgi:hypothetical protein
MTQVVEWTSSKCEFLSSQSEHWQKIKPSNLKIICINLIFKSYFYYIDLQYTLWFFCYVLIMEWLNQAIHIHHYTQLSLKIYSLPNKFIQLLYEL